MLAIAPPLSLNPQPSTLNVSSVTLTDRIITGDLLTENKQTAGHHSAIGVVQFRPQFIVGGLQVEERNLHLPTLAAWRNAR